jgi:hypothetical protein
MHRSVMRWSWAPMCPLVGPHYRFETTKVRNLEKLHGRKGWWPHLRVRYLSHGGPRGHCRYPTELRCSGELGCCHVSRGTSSRLRAAREPPRVPWCQLTPPGSGQLRCRYASRGASSCLPAQGSLGATMCPVVLAPTSWLGVAQVPPCVPGCQLPPPGSRQLRCRHVSHGTL